MIGLIGVISVGDPGLLVLQYCDRGSLLGVLRKSDPARHDGAEEEEEEEAQRGPRPAPDARKSISTGTATVTVAVL